jgi:predicted PurR-regulated permease PerM
MKFGQWLGIVALVLSLYILWEIRQLLLLLFLAVVFATALNRLVGRLQRLGVKRGGAVAISVLGLLALLVLFVALIVPPFLQQFQQLTQLVPQGLNLLQTWIDRLIARLPGGAVDSLPNVNDLMNQVQPLARGLLTTFSDCSLALSTLLGSCCLWWSLRLCCWSILIPTARDL